VASGRAKIIVVGNQKGGTGKTTVAMHLAIGLLRRGLSVATVDLDAQQQSLTRYLANRALWCEENAIGLLRPRHRLIEASKADSRIAAEAENRLGLTEVLASTDPDSEVVILDCPAGEGPLSRAAHERADILVSPLNDSFVDLDPLLQFRPGSFQAQALGPYFRMLWEIRNDRRRRGERLFTWIVLRNRLSGLDDRNKRNLGYVLTRIAPIMRFHFVDGLSERIIFRQLFHQGLTVFDCSEPLVGIFPTASHVAAQEELGLLLDSLEIDAAANVMIESIGRA
jgi:chromosome partitioning protein